MTYQTAYNKIIDAYFKDEIEPYNMNFCFCGTIGCNKISIDYWDTNLYTSEQYHKMEFALLGSILSGTVGDKYGDDIYVQDSRWRDEIQRHPNYEFALFAGMSAALDVLKSIHIERGEVIDETPVFTKRQLA